MNLKQFIAHAVLFVGRAIIMLVCVFPLILTIPLTGGTWRAFIAVCFVYLGAGILIASDWARETLGREP